MTNSSKIANRLAKHQCDNSHWHFPLMGGRAGACQVYPRPFCAQICLGLEDEFARRQINAVQLGHLDAIRGFMEVHEPHPNDDVVNMEHLHSGRDFYDDISGKWLDKDLVITAMCLDI